MILVVILSMLPGGIARDRSCRTVRVPLQHELPVRHRLGDHVRTDARGRVLRQVLERRVARHEAGEPIASTCVNEPSGAVSLIVMSPVVSSVVMPEMSPSALPASRYSSRALDAEEERATARLEVEDALDRVLEVGGLDGRAVRVLQPLAQLQLVGLAVRGDLRQVLGQARDQLRARLPLLARVGDQRRVDEPQRLDAVDGVRERRVQ